MRVYLSSDIKVWGLGFTLELYHSWLLTVQLGPFYLFVESNGD